MLERSGRQNVRVDALLGRMIEMLIFEQRLEGNQHLVIRENSGTSRARVRAKALWWEWQV